MTTKDKTGDQLMASIRKTKTQAAAADKQAPGTRQTSAPTAKTATAKGKPAAPRTQTRRPRAAKKKVTARPKPRLSVAGAADTRYQSAGRVWPD